jgi:hypothetical protein
MKAAIRWKPDVMRTSLETLSIVDQAGEGSITMIAQLVAYDDTKVNGATYVPGDFASEKFIVVCHERVFTYDIAGLPAAFAQIQAKFAADMAAFRDEIQPNALRLALICAAAKLSPPVAVTLS